MQEDEDFFIDYNGHKVKVSPVINGGNIFFIVHFTTPVTIAEGLVGEEWRWYEPGKGETSLAAALGEIIELQDEE
jgi:hypothetical protein